MQKISGIYKITNIITKDFYIGKSINIIRRWHDHKYTLTHNKSQSHILQNAVNKYKFNNFIFEILEKTKDIDSREIYYIKKLKPKYNIILTQTNSNPHLGENNYNSKITNKEAKEIKRLISLYYTKDLILDKFLNLTTKMYSEIINNNCWIHIPWPKSYVPKKIRQLEDYKNIRRYSLEKTDIEILEIYPYYSINTIIGLRLQTTLESKNICPELGKINRIKKAEIKPKKFRILNETEVKGIIKLSLEDAKNKYNISKYTYKGIITGLHYTQYSNIKRNKHLTKEQVLEIRNLFSKGINRKDLSKQFNKSYTCIKDIISNRTWKNLTT